ncbi:defensin-like protein precursor [Nicotiana tabacum]|uniref:Defensin-like protein n=3 Tax=Nicotiana TaxID=4085 RepID=DEF_TOBAC|nr:defensin-like protein precursor [Nicotiana tabacum]XP_009793542.1 PREDICTED: defensin-like protein [Nicotiana sylvestris]P32026.1 RecName: Full=Defensin-like protein; AltName: Full=Flower-specific gamma-thionin; Flags: Precursor [Nicotiana tabacum]CAA77806.1 flower-specific thionin [Nicotiana tabacum]
MARSLCFMAFAILAMMLFVAYEVQARECKTESNTFPGICITKPPCRKACISEKFTDGHCSKLLRRCLCTKPCVFDEKMIKTGAETLVEEAKTLAAALLEEEIMDN